MPPSTIPSHRVLRLAPLLLGVVSACTTVTSADMPLPTTSSTSTTTTTTIPPSTLPRIEPDLIEQTDRGYKPPPPPTALAPIVEIVGPAPEPIVAVGGANGEATRKIQERLAVLGFWSGRSADGVFGLATQQAVMAFQKYHGLEASGRVDDATAFTMTTVEERAHSNATTGTLVEVDKARQLLFIVVEARTLWVFNASTGSEIPYEEPNKQDPTKIERGDSITPNGLWRVNRERPEGWWDGDLGKIYRPKYFVGGVAVHGSPKIPNYPASHGCVRVSVPAMDFIWESGFMPIGTPVWVHG
ncbi:MAG: peptidoglycan-binding protein [Ilumatobacteraceae bacterium]